MEEATPGKGAVGFQWLCGARAAAARASFLAQVHPASGLEEWLTSVIRERIELEEEALAEAKRDLSEKREA